MRVGCGTKPQSSTNIGFVIFLSILFVIALGGCPAPQSSTDAPGSGDAVAVDQPAQQKPVADEPADAEPADAEPADQDNQTTGEAGKAGEGIIAVTGSDFKQVVLESEMPVLVDFWASWCAPCEMVHPVLEQIEDKYRGKIVVAKVDVDNPANGELANEYGIRSIPAVFLFDDGHVADQWIGYDDSLSQVLSAAIDKVVSKE